MSYLTEGQTWSTSDGISRTITKLFAHKSTQERMVTYKIGNTSQYKSILQTSFLRWIKDNACQLNGEQKQTIERKTVMSNLPKLSHFSHIRAHERVMVFIDGANTRMACRALPNPNANWKTFYELLSDRCDLRRAYYYVSYIEDRNRPNNAIIPLTHFLMYNSYTVVNPALKSRKVSRSVCPDLSVDLVFHAAQKNMDHAILLAGDSQYIHAVETAKLLGVKITVVSTLKTVVNEGDEENSNETSDSQFSPICSNSLRSSADHFVDLSDLPIFDER